MQSQEQEQQIAAIRKALENAGVTNWACPACGGELMPEPDYIVQNFRSPGHTTVMMTSRGLPRGTRIVLSCGRCGYVRLHDARKLGFQS
jgi:ribosomal protein S27AE